MIEQLLNQPNIWQGRHYQSPEGIDSGHPTLNNALPGNGWPRDGIIEIVSTPGMGEVSLLLPALRHAQRQGHVIFLSVPWQLHGPQLAEQGLDLNQVLSVDAPMEQQQWCAEQSLKSAACSALLFWPSKALTFTAYRRLQILCHERQKPCFLFMRQASKESPCSVRVAITHRTAHGIELQILKSRGTWVNPSLSLPLNPVTSFLYPVQ